MLKVHNRISIPESNTSGMDSIDLCNDRSHFQSYHKNISYKYNSKGFRDNEWPKELSDVIWCVGDSFTVGIGQPFEETWPQMLQEKIGKRCLNIGEDGCSNDTMAMRVQEIHKLHNPKLIVIMWSYFSRRRMNNVNIPYDRQNFGQENDLKNFVKNFEMVNSLPINVIHSLIPNAFEDEKYLKETYKNLLFVKQLDYARDRFHFDVKTSTGVCDLIIKNTTLTNGLNNLYNKR